jgi:hypothetical protein
VDAIDWCRWGRDSARRKACTCPIIGIRTGAHIPAEIGDAAAFPSAAHLAAYYARKIHEGKRHNQALLCLARRHCDVLYAMIRNGTFYDAGPARSS